MSGPTQALLIEETGDRAVAKLQSLLTLLALAFETGEARARALVAGAPERIIDPVASACFAEARELLERPTANTAQQRANFYAALFALDVAAYREPNVYALTQRGVRELALAALDEVVALELEAAAERAALAPQRPA